MLSKTFFIFERRSSNHDIARDFDHFIDDQKSEEKNRDKSGFLDD